ncbi:MAG: hypothetical protein O3B19_11160 [Actinomycetota bacterium]|nr:hypothetical protein [Actinomycetota bacterium]MDA2972714.1 hypothetical protein [Actinomycetota bacterium]
MFRTVRPLVSLLAAGLLVLGACGGDDSGSVGNSDSADQVSSDDETSDDSSSGKGGAEELRSELNAAVEALPEAEYKCTPDEYSMTTALKSTCIGFTSLFMGTHAWADASSADAQIGSEIMCTVDSPMGEFRFLKGETWAISAIPTSGSTADKSAEIDAAFSELQASLGGEQSSVPCG